jgi:predicted nucleic acid-binding protein
LREFLFVDTSAWFAFANRADPDHDSIRALLTSFEGHLATSNFILDETVTLVLYRLGHHIATRVGDTLLDSNVVHLVRATADDETRAWQLFHKRADQTYSYTDCVSFEMMKRLGVSKVAALDDDFRREGFEALP